jgi:hypothetical protein
VRANTELTVDAHEELGHDQCSLRADIEGDVSLPDAACGEGLDPVEELPFSAVTPERSACLWARARDSS